MTRLLDVSHAVESEHFCGLEAVPERGARSFTVQVKVKGFGTFPVRAFAAVES